MDNVTDPTTTSAAQSALTDADKATIRDAALGAMAMVSRSEPGFFAMFKESMAGSQALKSAPASVQDLFKASGFPSPPTGTPEQVEATVLGQLGSAVALLKEKAPGEVEGYQQAILAACDAVANAAKGVSVEEQAMIGKVRAALTPAG